eukprot:12106185-Alexandrium_andersonii.AAC.1
MCIRDRARWPCPTSFQSQGYTVLSGPAGPGSTSGCHLWASNTLSVAEPSKSPVTIAPGGVLACTLEPRVLVAT